MQRSKGHPIPDPDPQHFLLFGNIRFVVSRDGTGRYPNGIHELFLGLVSDIGYKVGSGGCFKCNTGNGICLIPVTVYVLNVGAKPKA